MTCRDFQQIWDELLDAEAGRAAIPDGARPEPTGADGRPDDARSEALLLAHAAECPACRPIAARYQVLRHAIRAWRQQPAPAVDLVGRILSDPAATDEFRPPAAATGRVGWPWGIRRPALGLVSGLAAAALLCLVLGFAIDRVGRPSRPERLADRAGDPAHDAPETSVAQTDSLALNRALADATSATWDLARSASAPAARISRDVLDATSRSEVGPMEAPAGPSSKKPGEGLASLSVAVPSLDPLTPDTSAVLQQVGDQLSAGVQPLSSTARHAFSFLLGPPSDRDERRTRG